EGWVRLVGTLGGMTVAVISATLFLTLQWKYWPYSGSLILTGGTFGVWVTDLLVKQFNTMGATLVSLFAFSLALAVSTPVSIARIGAATIRVGSLFVWKSLKLAAVYLFYLVGLLGVRAAAGVSQGLQNILQA